MHKQIADMDPAQLKEQREKVQKIRKTLEEFEYATEDEEPHIKKEYRSMQTLADNAQY